MFAQNKSELRWLADITEEDEEDRRTRPVIPTLVPSPIDIDDAGIEVFEDESEAESSSI